MQHAGKPQVLHEGGRTGHLSRDIDARNRFADDFVLCGRLRRHLGGGLAPEVRLRGELTVGDLAAVRRKNDAVIDL